MQAFSGDLQMPESWLIVPTMLDLQNLGELQLQLRQVSGEGPTPLAVVSTIPNHPLLLKAKMVAIEFPRPKSMPASFVIP